MLGLVGELRGDGQVRIGGGHLSQIDVQCGAQERKPAGGDQQPPMLDESLAGVDEAGRVCEVPLSRSR
ncbi:hypothetical protein GCM10010166_39200 [Couchioplanes caeruleus subsp. azureus]|nr:hypothetical protein GCM10010166_39200 [Couchioplanes caeruleus subsp. azureus]